MNKVLLTGRLTRDPEVRTTASGKTVATFSIATHQYVGGKELSDFHSIVTWNRLADTCGKYLGKGQLVGIEGRIATRSWESQGQRHWKTEIVASSVEMLSRARRKDFAGETAADALEAQAAATGYTPDASEPIADDSGFSVAAGAGDEDEDEEEDELLEEAAVAA